MAEWQKVFEYNTPYRVEIVKAILDKHGLNPIVMNKKDTAYQLGQFEVRVHPDNVIKAIRIINEEIQFE